MRYIILVGVIVLGVSTSFQNCAEGPRAINQDQDLKTTHERISEIIAADYCQSDIECKAIPYGMKACGGPREYIVHSQTANFSELEQLVNAYNEYERQQNLNNGAISTCEFLLEPSNLHCVNNKCLAQ